MRPLPIPQHLLSLLRPQRFQSDLPYRPCHASASQLHDLHELFSPTSGRRQPQAMENTTSSGLSVGNWIEIETSTVEVDGALEVPPVAEAAGLCLDGLNLGVEPFADGVRDAVGQEGHHVGQVTLDQPPG